MDLDENGQLDILSGSYSRMEPSMAGLFQVLHGQKDGTFQKAAVLNGTDDKPLIIPADQENQIENICTRPFAVDWDGDKDLDLVVGNFAGTFYLFEGEGKGKFQPESKQLMAGDEPLKISGYHSDPFVIDWDGDGDLDLLSGSSEGGVQWAENQAGAGELPQFKSFQPLIKPGTQYGQSVPEEELKGPTSSTRIWIDDVNSDGKFDLLVGDSLTVASSASGLDAEELKKKQEAWEKELAEVVEKLNSDIGDEKERAETVARFKELSSQRGQFNTKPDRTGFVWLYLQK